MKVAILGPRGTYSEEAARKVMAEPDLELCQDIEEVFEAVEVTRVEYGIVPHENSLEGSVGMTMENLLNRNVQIYQEVVEDIRHSLMAKKGTSIQDIKEVISHPHALAQCKSFLKKLGVATQNFPSTAGSAKYISEKGLPGIAAIAPKIAAQLYDLDVLKEGVQDDEHNQTRFLVISTQDHTPTGSDKTSIVIGLHDRPGALYDVLGAFAKRDVNLTKIESRPSRKGLGDYLFFIDFEGHRKDANIAELLEELKADTSFFKILGSYPRG